MRLQAFPAWPGQLWRNYLGFYETIDLQIGHSRTTKLRGIAVYSPCLWVDPWGETVHALILALQEDDKNSSQVAESLQQSGHRVLQSKSFTQALQILQTQTVDLIISDVHLENGGTVFDFLRRVKLNPCTKDTPFVLFSSKPTSQAKVLEDGIRTTARLLGASMYITMEIFDPVDFCRQINSLLPVESEPSKLTTKGSSE